MDGLTGEIDGLGVWRGQPLEQRTFADVRLAHDGGGFAIPQTVEDGAQFVFAVEELATPDGAAIDEGLRERGEGGQS